MKNKTFYYVSIAVISVLLFIIISYNISSSNRVANTTQKQEDQEVILHSDVVPFNDNSSIIPIHSLDDLKDLGLLGEYWNHPYVRINDIEEDDQLINLSISEDKKFIDLYFEHYMPRVDADDEVEIVARYDCDAILEKMSKTTFQILPPKYSCLDDYNKLCFLKKGEQVGLSFDGKTIAYYKEQKVFSSLKTKDLLSYFYPDYKLYNDTLAKLNNSESVTFKRKTTFVQEGIEYTVILFQEGYFVEYDPRSGGDFNESLSIALFKKTEKGQQMIYFDKQSDCSSSVHDFGERTVKYIAKEFRIQKIGNKHFFFKESIKEDSLPLVKTVYCYDFKTGKEVFSQELEVYDTDRTDKKTYSLRKEITFAEESGDCAIVINTWNLEKNAIIPSDLTIYIYDENENKFVKPNT